MAKAAFNLSEIDEIIERSRKRRFSQLQVSILVRILEVALILVACSIIGYQYVREFDPMTQPQGTILRTLVEKVATLHREPVGIEWEEVRGDLGIPRDAPMTRRQWIIAVRALAAEIDRQ